MVIPTFNSGSFERTLLDNECSTTDSKSKEQQRLQHRFLVLRKLGQGTYGKVQLAINKETNQEVAIKTIKKAKIQCEEDMLRIRREIHIMKSIRHPFIIHIHEVFETRQKIVIVMQYASGGELYDYLGCHNSLPEEEARRIFRQIASAIYYCHKNKICHRDLKLENILLDDVGNAQIADFGLSNIFDEKRRMNTFCGSPLYASPEIVKGTPYKGPEVDCWSLGVLLYTLIYGTMPFDGRSFKELVTQISEGRYEEPPNKSRASILIRRLLTPDISRRATIMDVCLDSWVNEGYNTSLLNIAEKMAWDATLKTKSLSLAKFTSEQNGREKATPTIIQTNSIPTLNGTTSESANSTNGHNGKVSRNSDLYEQILSYDVKFIINKLLGGVESAIGNAQNKTLPPLMIPTVKENGTMPLKTWPQNGESTPSKVESAYVIPIFEVTSVMPKTNKILRKRNSIENSEKSSKQLPNGLIHPNNDECIQKEDKKKLLEGGKEKSKEDQEQSQKEQVSPEKSVEACQQKTRKPAKNNENFKLASKHLGPFFRNNALTLARIFSAKYERLVRTSIKMPERKRPVPGKLVIPSTFDPAAAPNSEVTQKKEQILLFPTVSVSENKEKIEKKIDKIKKAALNRSLILRSNSHNRLKIQKFLLSQAKKMQDFMCEDQRGGNGSMHHLNKCDVLPEVYHLFDKSPMNPIGTRQHSKRINFNDFGKSYEFDLARRKMFRVNYLTVKKECNLFIAKSKSDVQFPTYFSSADQQCGNLLDVPQYASIQRSASDSEGLQIFRNAFEYIKHCENNKNDIELSIPNSIYDQHFLDKGESSELTKEQNQDIQRSSAEKNTDAKEESKTIIRSNSISICTDLFDSSSNFLFIKKQLPSLNNVSERNNSYLLNKESIYTNKLKSFLGNVEGKQNELFNEKMLKRRNSLSCIPDHKFLTHYKETNNFNKFVEGKYDLNFEDRLAVLNKQIFSMNNFKNEANFFSSPNLSPNTFENIPRSRLNDSKSIDSLNSRLSSSNDSEEFNFLPSMRRSSQTSQLLRQILQDSYDDVNSDPILSRSRAKSVAEGTFSVDDMIRKLLNSHNVDESNHKSPFLSKFLNELEKGEQNGTKDIKLKNRRPSKNLSSPAKKPKSEKRSQSFLQLLALKRIHEAEKELDKAERNHTVNAENESAGSLLEALKTHGYKGVISQLSQESGSDPTDALTTSSYLARKRALDFHRYNSTYYDTIPQYNYPAYNFNDLDITPYDGLEFTPYTNNLDTSPYNTLNNTYSIGSSPYSFDATPFHNFDPTPYNFDLTPNNTFDPTPYNFNSLPYNLDPTLYNSDLTSCYTPGLKSFRNTQNLSGTGEFTSYTNSSDETPQNTLDSTFHTNTYRNNFPKQHFSRSSTTPSSVHRSRFSLEMPEEAPSAHVPNWDRHTKPEDEALQSPETPTEPSRPEERRKKYSITELPDAYTTRTERNPLLRASSTPEDDERESVQDRIWRKSFYSRFNNSALSRKERSSLLDSEFSQEVRANGIRSLDRRHSTNRDHSKWQPSKPTSRKYSLTRDSSVASCRSRQRSYDVSDENISKIDSNM